MKFLYTSNALAALTCAAFAFGLTGCGGGSGDGDGSGTVIDEQQTISEGGQVSYQLPAGTYDATITSSNNGVVISWPGGSNCPSSAETKSYSGTCLIPASGQLVITNPTLLGLGGDEISAIKVNKE
jgi:hypothetical protein